MSDRKVKHIGHTPGPWIASGVFVLNKAGVTIANCGHSIVMDHDEKMANTRLVAAVPKMLALVHHVAETDPSNESAQEILTQVGSGL